MSELDEFLNGRTDYRFDLKPHGEALSPLLLITAGQYAMVINPMYLAGEKPHISLDVHSFVDGTRGHAGVMGMTNGRTFRLGGEKPEHTSHGWPATALVAVLLGRQA